MGKLRAVTGAAVVCGLILAMGLWVIQLRARGNDVVALIPYQDNQCLITAFFEDGVNLCNPAVPEGRALDGPFPSLGHAALSRSEKYLVLCYAHRLVELWTLGDKKKPWSRRGHDSIIAAVSFSPDDALCITAGWDRRVRAWNTKNGSMEFEKSIANAVSSLCIPPDGSSLFVGCGSGDLFGYELHTPNKRIAMSHRNCPVLSMIFVPGVNCLAVGYADGSIVVLDVKTLAEISVLSGHSREVSALACTSDGRFLVSVGKAHGMRGRSELFVWDLPHKHFVQLPDEHDCYISAVAILDDRSEVLTGDVHGRIVKHNLPSGKLAIP
jgi:WD40 repeat protein